MNQPGDDRGGVKSAGVPKKTFRTSRNLPAAIAVAVALIAVIIGSLFLWRYSFVAIVAIAVGIGTIELVRVLQRETDITISALPVFLGGQAIVWLSWPYGLQGTFVAFVFTVLVCFVWRLAQGNANYLRDVAVSIFTVAYLPLCATFAALLVLPEDGIARVLVFLLAVIASDTGGYVVGVLLGKHPLAPSISPGKTWEGSAGSVLLSIIVSSITFPLLLSGEIWHGMIFGAVVAASAICGDLIESSLKRDLGVKDMGSLLPGHGGIMERLDSLLPSAVVSWALLAVFHSG